MVKMIYFCDRCKAEIKGTAKYIAVMDITEDGDLVDSEGPFDESQFCSKCIAEIRNFVLGEPGKRRGRPRKE